MFDVTPSQGAADRNLLFGILALQMDFISRDALVAAMHAWVLDKANRLGQILVEQGALAAKARDTLEAIVKLHLELHGGNPRQSLAAVGSIGSLRQELQAVADADLQASLAQISAHGTALELRADIKRWLGVEPVNAYQESWSVRIDRWLQRHRPLVAGAAALLLAAVPLALVIAVNREQARRQAETDKQEMARQKDLAQANEKAATERAAETKAVLEFVEDRVFAAARLEGKEGGLGHAVTLRQAVEAALPFVANSFTDDPLIEARLRRTLGTSFTYLGDAKNAVEQYEPARAHYARYRGPDHPDTLAIMHSLAMSYYALGRYADALKLHEETLTLQRARLGPDHPDTLRSMKNLARSYAALGRPADALKVREETLSLMKAEVVRDDKRPGKPVTGVSFSMLPSDRRAKDADLKELAGFKHLTMLFVAGPEVTDAGVKELADFKHLTQLCLIDTNVTDEGVKELAKLKNLTVLHLAGSKVTDAGLKELAPLQTLAGLFLGNTAVTDAGLKALTPLQNLGTLELTDTALTDAALGHLAAFKNLHTLYLGGTRVTDAGVKALIALPNLSTLHLYRTAVTEAGVKELKRALPKCKVIQ